MRRTVFLRIDDIDILLPLSMIRVYAAAGEECLPVKVCIASLTVSTREMRPPSTWSTYETTRIARVPDKPFRWRSLQRYRFH